MAEPVLELRSVVCGPPPPATAVLHEISLTLHGGETAVLLGASGSGKTTLLKTAAGLWRPHRGIVIRLGRESSGFDAAAAGCVLEDPPSQFVATTVRGELEFALENRGFEPAVICRRVGEVLERLELDGLSGRDPFSLSVGEQQLCLIAAALVLRPLLLILDDPFAHLDPGRTETVWSAVRTWLENDRRASVLVAARDAELAVEARTTGILDEGHLVAWGPPEQVLRAPLPEAVSPPFAVRAERSLGEIGIDVAGGSLNPEALAHRVSAEAAR